jgi:hypothetical protein
MQSERIPRRWRNESWRPCLRPGGSGTHSSNANAYLG